MATGSISVIGAGQQDLALQRAAGQIAGQFGIRKFGMNPAIAAAADEPLTPIGTLNFLTVPSTLRVKAGGNANDSSGGTGAQSIIVQGLNQDWDVVQEELTTNGIAAGPAGAITFIRVFRCYVNRVGTYASVAGGANIGQVVVEKSGGGTDLISLRAGNGQSEYASYTVPAGYTAFLTAFSATVQSAKEMEIQLFQRGNAQFVVTPFQGKRLVAGIDALTGEAVRYLTTYDAFSERTDLWVQAINSSGAPGVASASFDLIVVRQ